MHLHVISVASVCVYDQSHTLDDNIAFDLQPLYFQFDGRSSCTQFSTAITSVYINGGGGGGGGGEPLPKIFRLNTHWCIQAFQTDITK